MSRPRLPRKMPPEKACARCGEVKPNTEFNRNKTRHDLLQKQCRRCQRDTRLGYKRPIDPDQRRQYAAGWREENRDAVRRRQREYRENNPEKVTAHRKLNNEIKYGRIARPDECEECHSEVAVQAHHDDYSKPLDVRWLCPACHSAQHSSRSEAPNPESVVPAPNPEAVEGER